MTLGEKLKEPDWSFRLTWGQKNRIDVFILWNIFSAVDLGVVNNLCPDHLYCCTHRQCQMYNWPEPGASLASVLSTNPLQFLEVPWITRSLNPWRTEAPCPRPLALQEGRGTKQEGNKKICERYTFVEKILRKEIIMDQDDGWLLDPS